MEKVKEAVELAEKELQEEEDRKQIDLIKKAIKQTLEKIKDKENERSKLNKEIKTLKQDIDNIRAGRLDLIAERQEKDDDAKQTSIIEVIKEKEIHHHHYHDRWYEPYRIIYKWYDTNDAPDYYTVDHLNGTTTYHNTGDYIYYNTCDTETLGNTSAYTLTNSLIKDSYAGTYKLSNGDCVTLT
jgi:hypothetical protein